MLRDKETGEVVNGCFVVCEYKDGARFSVKDKPVFDSLAELNEKWEKGEDVDVRLEQSICKINVKNIKGAGKYISEYFANCVMPRKELEEKLKKR